jgi:hypothetical protein
MRLASIVVDERYSYPPANVNINAPLALVQVCMKAEAGALSWVLGIEPPKLGPRKNNKGRR